MNAKKLYLNNEKAIKIAKQHKWNEGRTTPKNFRDKIESAEFQKTISFI